MDLTCYGFGAIRLSDASFWILQYVLVFQVRLAEKHTSMAISFEFCKRESVDLLSALESTPSGSQVTRAGEVAPTWVIEVEVSPCTKSRLDILQQVLFKNMLLTNSSQK